jgi:hypothetical protein
MNCPAFEAAPRASPTLFLGSVSFETFSSKPAIALSDLLNNLPGKVINPHGNSPINSHRAGFPPSESTLAIATKIW